MKNAFVLLFLLCFLTGCSEQKSSYQETVTTYFKARDASNYNQLKTAIGDSISIIAGDYIMPYNQDSFYVQFKWDSVFRPSYKIVELEEKNKQIIASVALNSVRNEFLKNKAMTCQYLISFNAGKISKIKELECEGVDWKVWSEERDSLVSWISKNHPKLDGFINDMTMNGALNYVKAIELYETDKNNL